MSYGVIGFVLFGLFILTVLSGADWFICGYLGTAIVYGITHNGVRETMFWLLGLCLVVLRSPSGCETAGEADRTEGRPRPAPDAQICTTGL